LRSYHFDTKALRKRQHYADASDKPLFRLARPKKSFQLNSVVITEK
jgi:hypothetical protein